MGRRSNVRARYGIGLATLFLMSLMPLIGNGGIIFHRHHVAPVVNPHPHPFEAISPAEFHVPANRQVARADLELRNTAECRVVLARLCGGQWSCGLVPSYRVEFADDTEGPILRDSVVLDLKKLSGNWIHPGNKSCPITVEFKLKEGISIGDRETFRIIFSLTNPKTGRVQTSDWAVDVVVRGGGLPLLISETIPFPSQEGE